jgi:hypothetical protein
MAYFGPGFGLGKGPLIDGEDTIMLGRVSTSATPAVSVTGGGQTSTASYSGKKPAVAISVPGNIITEEVAGSEGLIVEELFEDLSLFELMELGRSDSVLGLNITYQPIKNLSDIYFTYSPKKILALSGTFGDSDESSALKLGQYSVDGAMSIDPLTGDLLVAVDNVKDGFVVQVEIVSGGEIQDS